jgi:hypothetical protein
MLTVGILCDNGAHSLQERIDELHKLVLKGMPALPGDNKGFTPEEEFIAIAIRNKTVHARAKVIILQMLDQIKNPEKRYPGIRFRLAEDPSVT